MKLEDLDKASRLPWLCDQYSKKLSKKSKYRWDKTESSEYIHTYLIRKSLTKQQRGHTGEANLFNKRCLES